MEKEQPKDEEINLLDKVDDMNEEASFALAMHREEIVKDINVVMAKCKKIRNSGRLCKFCPLWVLGRCLFRDKYQPILFDKDYSKFDIKIGNE